MLRSHIVIFTFTILTTIVTASMMEPVAMYRQPESRKAPHTLPPTGNTIDSYLKYCEAVIHSLESELPRKSIFRSLFMDKARLSSGYDKHMKFSYFDVLKNLPDQHY
ncbi:hypothetical protein RP20_CCG001616 [Aedes albopictus]|nr:hypothetical protein RP20_CCG001616 [Aedes albopictus]